MTQTQAIFWVKKRIAAHSLASIQTESRLKMGVVGTAAILLWYGALKAFDAGFAYLQSGAFQGVSHADEISLADILMVRLLSIFSLALLFMLVFSNILIAFSTLYKAKEVQYLLHAPITTRTLYLSRLMECISLSSWASAYLGSPLIIAYGTATHAHPGYYLTAILFYVPFVTIPAAIGSIITIVLVRIFPKLPRAALFLLAAVAIVVFFLKLRATFNAEQLAQNSIISSVLTATTQTQSPLLPSYWASQGILTAAQNQYQSTLFYFALLCSNALMLTLFATETANLFFRSGYSSLLGSEYTQPKPIGKGILGRLDTFTPTLIRNPYRALIIKDIKLFWRDPVQWTQFVIFFGIMAVYVANIGNQDIEMQSERYRAWVATLNTAACTLILASLTSRFVYPLVSLEGFRFWILGLAPLTKKQLIWQKYTLSLLMTTPFTLGLTFVSSYFLKVTPLHFIISIYTIVLANLALAGLATGLGALYPNFEEDNPSRIVSGMGGTLNFLLSVTYISIVAGSQMFILMWYVRNSQDISESFWIALISILSINTLLSLLACLLPMRLGLKNLIKTEL